MVAYNITLDDTSPLLTYTGTWIRKHPEEDTKLEQYFNKNFAKTRTAGDTASLRFNGTAVWAYGSRRESHGKFKVSFDGEERDEEGYLAAPGRIQDVLFSRTGLDAGVEHSLTLMNTEAKWFDVEYYVIQHEEGDDQTELKTLVVDTPSPEFFKYSGEWNLAYSGAEYSNQTGALSYASGEAVEFTFEGSSVAVYGAVNSNRGMYRVIIDGVSQEYSGYYDGGLTGQTVLFHRAGLANGAHTVSITNLGEKPRNYWGLDYVVVNSTAPREGGEDVQESANVVPVVQTTGPSSSMTTSGTLTVKPTVSSTSNSVVADLTPIASQTSDIASTSSSSTLLGPTDGAVLGGANLGASRTDNGLSNGALAGIIIASITTVAGLILLIWFLIRRRNKNKDVTAYPWNDQRRLASTGGSSPGGGLSSLALTGSPVSPYQDTPFSGRQYPLCNAWTGNASPNMAQLNSFTTGAILPLPTARPPVPASNMSYYPYAQSVSPPTEAPEPEDTLSDSTRSTTDRAYSGMSPHSPFHHTAPSSGAIPSVMGEPVEIRTASQGYSTRPNITSLTSGHPSSLSPYQPSRHSDRSASPLSTRDNSFGRRKQQGTALPPTASAPLSTFSQDELSAIRMIVEGRLQDWGPVSVPEEETILPPDYSQATEPLPGRPGSDRNV